MMSSQAQTEDVLPDRGQEAASGRPEPPSPPTAQGSDPARQEGQVGVSRGLTRRQSLFWPVEQVSPSARHHNLVLTIDLRGPLDVPRLRAAWLRTVLDHDGLRTVVDRVKPQQVVVAEAPELPVVDLADPDALPAWLEGRSTIALGQEAHGLRWDAALVRLSPERHVFYLCQHHVVSDGLSMLVVAEHLAQRYQGLEPPPHASFEEYTSSERAYRESPRAERDRLYWMGRLPTEVPALHLYGRRRADSSTALVRATQDAGPERARRLAALAERPPFATVTPGLSRLAVIATALAAFLYRASGQREILIATPYGNRSKRFSRTYGLLMEELFLPLEIDEGETFESLAAKVTHELAAGIRHGQFCTSDWGLDYVSLNMMPPFPTSFADLAATYALGPATILAGVERCGTADSSDAISLQLNDFVEGQLHLSLDLHAATYDRHLRERAGAHLLRVVDAMLADPAAMIARVDLLGDEDRRQVLAAGRGPEPEGEPPDVIEAFRAQVAARPHKIAVEASDGSLTYAQLDRMTNALAARLREVGVRRERRVGVALPRGARELAAIVAVLKAGGCYVPIDPLHPAERIRLLLEDAAPDVLLTTSDSSLPDLLPENAQSLFLDDLSSIQAATGAFDAAEAPGPMQRAYILFTSGSTGRPKGVENVRGALSNFLRAMAAKPGMGPDDRLLAITTTTFDIAQLELLLPLWVGATVVIADREAMQDPRQLRDRLEVGDITLLQATPLTWRVLLETGWGREGQGAGLRMLCGGEALSPELAQRLLATGGTLWNMYGPTEATIWSTAELVERDAGRITIGRPIDHTQIYVLDDDLRLLPAGVTGEIFIGGRGLARGYLGRPDLTAERFLPNPHGPPGDRIYRTGDLGRLLDDGRFECLGRVDHQVKIRGFRIELGEIESYLRGVPGVDEALVVARSRAGGDPELCAYWIGSATAEALLRHLQVHLPIYMVPSAFVPMTEFPVNTNGKVDRKALPAPDIANAVGGTSGIPLRTTSEERMAAIWSEVLQVPVTAVDQDFLALGGTSLKAIEVRQRIEQAFGVTLPLKVFFEAPTVEKLVARLGTAGDSSAPIVLPLRRAAEGLPMLHCLLGIVLYREMAHALPEGISVSGIHVPSRFVPGQDAFPTIEELAREYVRPIRASQPTGPYHLTGLCFGGIIAFEAARQLEAEGETVGSVSLLDSFLPAIRPADVVGRLLRKASEAKQGYRSLASRLRQRGEEAPVGPADPAGAVPVLADSVRLERQLDRYAASDPRIQAPVLVFRAQKMGRAAWQKRDSQHGWGGRSPRLEVHDIPSGHLDLVRQPYVERVADRISEAISRSGLR